MSNKAFTLVEIIVALVIISLTATIVTINTGGPLNDANWSDAISRIERADQFVRTYTENTAQPININIDLSENRIFFTDVGDQKKVGRIIKFPSGIRIAKLLVKGQALTGGVMPIRCSKASLTPTYAILVLGPNGRQVWLLIAGLSGQITEFENEEQIEKVWNQAILRGNAS